MLNEPVLTMPSSRLHPSWRVVWKYRSASSMRCSAIVASAADQHVIAAATTEQDMRGVSSSSPMARNRADKVFECAMPVLEKLPH